MFALPGQDGDDGREQRHPDGAEVPDEDHQLRGCTVNVRDDGVSRIGPRGVGLRGHPAGPENKRGPGDQNHSADHEQGNQGSGTVKTAFIIIFGLDQEINDYSIHQGKE